MHLQEERGMTARKWNRNQAKGPRLQSFAAALGGKTFLVFILLALGVLGQQGTSAQARRIELADFGKAVSVSDPQIAPDGKSIVYVVSRMNVEQDRNDRELVLLDLATGGQRVLTHDRKDAGSPRWSPTGDRIAFLVAIGPAKEEKAQIFILPMSGGEALKITDAPSGVEQFAWRPNGTEIAYVTADEPENKKDIEKHLDAFEIGDNGYLETKAPMPSHIWLVAADGGKPRRLTSGTWSLPKVLPPSSPSSPISWSPDGKSLTFTKQENAHSGDSDLRTVQILNVETGEARKLTAHERFEGFGLFSPDGSQVAYWYPRDGDRANENEIFVTAASGGDGQDATRAIDRNILRAIWMPDGKSLLVGGHDGTQVSLWMQPLGGAAKKLLLGDVSPSWSFWVDATVGRNGEIAFAGSTPNQPSELYYMATPNDSLKRLTSYNQEIAAVALGRTERFEWQGPDKFHEDGVLIYPPGFQKGTKYPLVLIIHGGPRATTTTQYSFLPQFVAAQDCVVFQPNYRGSENLGNAYTRAIWNDAGDGPGRDVMAGIEAVKKLGFVDESRIAVSGWSYGGYMTTWLMGHYQVWKVAVAGAAVTNMFDQYNLADFNVTERYIFNGSPYVGDNLRGYREQSPITYASQMKTPTLILSDTGDFRVTITQSYELYHALKDNGVQVRFFAYPVGGHFPADPVRQMDVYRRWSEWLVEHLK
jgi:dipeptidyl aminopeptidase/acylaminoacyl peptidase